MTKTLPVALIQERNHGDAEARSVLEQAFPGREIVPVPCRPLIWQNGSLHCITMQLPEGIA